MPDQSPHRAAEGRHRCGRLAGWTGSSQPARQSSRNDTRALKHAPPQTARIGSTCQPVPALTRTNSLQMLCRCRTSGLEVTGVSRKPTKGSPLTGWMAWGCKNKQKQQRLRHDSSRRHVQALSPQPCCKLQPQASHDGCSRSRLLRGVRTAAPTHPPHRHCAARPLLAWAHSSTLS